MTAIPFFIQSPCRIPLHSHEERPVVDHMRGVVVRELAAGEALEVDGGRTSAHADTRKAMLTVKITATFPSTLVDRRAVGPDLVFLRGSGRISRARRRLFPPRRGAAGAPGGARQSRASRTAHGATRPTRRRGNARRPTRRCSRT